MCETRVWNNHLEYNNVMHTDEQNTCGYVKFEYKVSIKITTKIILGGFQLVLEFLKRRQKVLAVQGENLGVKASKLSSSLFQFPSCVPPFFLL